MTLAAQERMLATVYHGCSNCRGPALLIDALHTLVRTKTQPLKPKRSEAFPAHLRREVNVLSVTAMLQLAMIGQQYDIERSAVDLTHEALGELRQRESLLVLSRLRSWLDGQVCGALLPQSSLTKAANYVKNH